MFLTQASFQAKNRLLACLNSKAKRVVGGGGGGGGVVEGRVEGGDWPCSSMHAGCMAPIAALKTPQQNVCMKY